MTRHLRVNEWQRESRWKTRHCPVLLIAAPLRLFIIPVDEAVPFVSCADCDATLITPELSYAAPELKAVFVVTAIVLFAGLGLGEICCAFDRLEKHRIATGKLNRIESNRSQSGPVNRNSLVLPGHSPADFSWFDRMTEPLNIVGRVAKSNPNRNPTKYCNV